MILSDSKIRERLYSGNIVIKPELSDEAIQPATIDLRLGPDLLRAGYDVGYDAIDLERVGVVVPVSKVDLKREYDNKYILNTNEFILGSTTEYLECPSDLVCRVEGKSSLGRIGLLVHATAGFIDPGFKGNITLEIKNIGNYPIVLRNNMKICQICFETLEGVVLRPYGHKDLGSRYQNSHGTVGAIRPLK